MCSSLPMGISGEYLLRATPTVLLLYSVTSDYEPTSWHGTRRAVSRSFTLFS